MEKLSLSIEGLFSVKRTRGDLVLFRDVSIFQKPIDNTYPTDIAHELVPAVQGLSKCKMRHRPTSLPSKLP